MIKNKENNPAYKKRLLDKSLLPKPVDYYLKQFPQLKIRPKYTSVTCPLHEDQNPSLSLNLITGSFKCFSCGVWGGDVIAFQMLRYKMKFVEAVTFLKGWRYVRS